MFIRSPSVFKSPIPCLYFLSVYTLSSFRASPKSSLNRRGVDDLDPLKHRSVALRAKKESFTLIYSGLQNMAYASHGMTGQQTPPDCRSHLS